MQHQIFIQDNLAAAIRHHNVRQAAGSDNCTGGHTELLLHTIDHPIDHGGVAKNRARFHAISRIFPDHMWRCFQADM
mgnify:CR=1 FL=1